MGLNLDVSRLKQKMETMNKRMAKQNLDKALEAGSQVITDAMKETVPIKTKELHDSLGKIRIEGSNSDRRILTGINSDKREVIERGYYQEYGHSTMIGKKWMKQASLSSKKQAVEMMIETLQEELKET